MPIILKSGFNKVLTLAICVCASACQRANDPGKPAAPRAKGQSNAIYSETRLNELITPGMSKDAIVKVFGNPLLESDGKEGILSLDFYAGSSWTLEPSDLAGFQVMLSSNKVIKWLPIYSTVVGYASKKRIPDANTSNRASTVREDTVKSLELAFFIVSETQIDGGTYIDTPLIPKLGYIAQKPYFSVRSLKGLSQGKRTSIHDGKSVEEATLVIALRSDDSPKLREMTAKNLGKKFLITFDKRPIITSLILSPIDTDSFILSLQDMNALNSIRQLLEGLVETGG